MMVRQDQGYYVETGAEILPNMFALMSCFPGLLLLDYSEKSSWIMVNCECTFLGLNGKAFL